jgi:hypothetical protein
VPSLSMAILEPEAFCGSRKMRHLADVSRPAKADDLGTTRRLEGEPAMNPSLANDAVANQSVADQSAGAATPSPRRLRQVLAQPFVGFAPWIVLGLVEGSGRLVWAAALAAALAAFTSILSLTVGVRPKILDITAIVYFGLLCVWAAAADPAVARWLGVWAAELSAVAIALIAGISLLVGRPFTLAYAKESTDPAYWKMPLFIRINRVITGVWVAVFGLIAIVGYIGDGPLHQPDNMWTNWVIQIGLIILAIKFTTWYPDYATADLEAGGQEDPRRRRSAQHADLARPMVASLVPLGILVMIIAGRAWWIGAAIMVGGIVATNKLHRAARQ